MPDPISVILGRHTIKLDNINTQLGKLGKIETQLGTLGDIETQLGKLGDLEIKLGEQSTKLGDIETQLGKLGDLDIKLGEQSTKLGDIETQLGKLGDIETQLGKLDGIDSMLGDHTSKLGGIDSKLGELNKNIKPGAPLSISARGEQVRELHQKLIKLDYSVPKSEHDEKVFGVGTRNALLKIQAKYGLSMTGVFDDATKAVLEKAVDVAETGKNHVEGRIFFDTGAPAGNTVVRLYTRGFGGAEDDLGDIKTNEQGFFSHSFDLGGKPSNFEVRIKDPDDPSKEIPLSKTKFSADQHEVLNLVIPRKVEPLDTEYKRLTNDLDKQLGGINKLANAQERDERQDLSFLNRETGWDARLIALAATAAKLTADTGISQDALYAMFRAGLPTDKQHLARVSTTAVEKALREAKKADIVKLTNEQIKAEKNKFEDFARSTLLNTKAPGAVSAFDELLNKSGVPEQQRKKFEKVYFTHKGTAEEMWEKAKKQGVSEQNINKLKLQGKLAYLTLNNAKLAEKLQQEIGSVENLPKLVDENFYNSKSWKTLIKNIAGNAAELRKLIPPTFQGEKTEDRLEAYAADLARKVRLNFPTQVVRQMVDEGELSLRAGFDKNDVVQFLKNALEVDKEFKLGQMPLRAFVQDNKDKLFPGNPPEEKVEKTILAVMEIQRVYQFTPTIESLKVAFESSFGSAQDVVAFTLEEFLERFGDRFPSREEAELVYRKAQQINAVTNAIVAAAKQMETAPPMHATSPSSAKVREEAKESLIKHYPTMKTLFGSLDFCECEHCRSVLSPAAYFVDLLLFLDPDELVWESFLENWKNKHGGKAYDDDYNYKKPYTALVERRPDLPHLPLTCDNTHTALPYIDVVNEILEYYVAHDKLDADSVRNTGDSTTPELLAEPQNIVPEAYRNLIDARYPLTLPFDLWLETVRVFFDHFETPLWKVLEVFRPADKFELFDQKPYSWADIFAEYLSISPSKYAIFTDADPLTNWFKLYGYPTEEKAIEEGYDDDQRIDLNSGKVLSRRLGVTYKELIELVQTSFVNPKLNKLSLVWKLRFEVHDVVRYYRDYGKPEYADEQQAFEDRLEFIDKKYKDYGLDAKAELDKLWNAGTFKWTLLLRDPSVLCNFDETNLEFAIPGDSDEEKAKQDEAFKLALLKINLFVRLWKKLGWTIEETDRALQVFLPSKLRPLTEANIGEALKTALVYLAHLKFLDEKVKVGKDSRLKLLTLWSDMATTGRNPLYAQLFLTPSVLKNDAVFDNPLGYYLCYLDPDTDKYESFRWDANWRPEDEDVKTGKVPLKKHLLAVQTALNLTADEVELILRDVELKLDAAPLSLSNVSLLYRYGILAKALKMSVKDIISLNSLCDIDPFKPLEPDPITDIEKDYPFKQTLRFIEIAEKVTKSGFPIEDLDYLLRHRFDPVGKYRSDFNVILSLVKSLAADIRRIQAEHAVPADIVTLTDDVIRQKLSLVLPAEAAETLSAMWAGTVEYEATRRKVEPVDKLDPAAFAGEPAIQVRYDEVKKEQYLTFKGVLLDAKKTQLKTTLPSPVLAALLDDVQAQAEMFFKRHLSGFFAVGDLELLFAPIPDDLPDEEKKRRMQEKREMLAHAFLKHMIMANAVSLEDEMLRQKLPLILPPNVAKTFLDMWAETVEYEATRRNVEPVDKLDPAAFAGEPAIQVRYDEVKKEQYLTFKGVLLDTKKTQLKTTHPSPVLAALLDDVQAQAEMFFKRHLSGFFAVGDLELLFAPIPDDLPDEEKQRWMEKKRARLTQALMLHVTLADPLSLTDEMLQQKLPLSLPPDVAKTFLDMWAGTVEYEATRRNVEPVDKLDPAAFAGEPAIQVRYDEIKKEQYITFKGVLLDAKKTQLKTTHPSPVLAALLDDVQQQARTSFDDQLASYLAMGDFDLLFADIPYGMIEVQKQSRVRAKRARLAGAFLPLLQQKLTGQIVVQTLATSLKTDPVLMEALLTKTSLLTDPSQPGKSLLEAFTAAGEQGFTAMYFASRDCTGDPLARPEGANSACIEGYLEVPTGGDYRFFVVLGKKDAEAELRVADLPNPLVCYKATKEEDEASQFVELKPIVPHQFALHARNLGGGGVNLVVLGENLPKGPLNRLTLYPQSAVERVRQAYVLLGKTVQLIQGLGLSEREVRYLLTHASDFDNFNLSQLPTRESDNSLAKTKALFSQFLRLVYYTRLKRDLAGETDDLIGVFETARRTYLKSDDPEEKEKEVFSDLCELIADLSRREATTVKTTAERLGFKAKSSIVGDELRVAVSDLTNEKGIWRLWEALLVVEKIGASVDALVRSIAIVDKNATFDARFAIARDLKNTVKARYEVENWQRIAQPIFDILRQRQRDALVAHIMHQDGFERIEQLFEHFLIDPGMEPVVQTSRLQLAIASVQMFIQRCLLNLEKHVHPSVINSKHWQWMKRYRVWEANRKIFLFPENWLEPEFRDDKTHLFQEFESALLQGDVSNDLAEDAFFQYLKKLEELARLEIVTMYCEEKPLDPASNTIHVIGRTYSLPHKYFYRRYAHQMWTPWEPVGAEIEGNHVVAVVWRQRLHLFWLTFLEKAKEDTKNGEMTLDIGLKIPTAAPKEVEVQLNWSEYFQGDWTTRESSGFGSPIVATVPNNFDSSTVFIHVSKEYGDDGTEQAVKIHLHFENALVPSRYRVGELGKHRFIYESPVLHDMGGSNPTPDAYFLEATHRDAAASRGRLPYFGDFAVKKDFAPCNRAFRVMSKNSAPESTSRGDSPLPPPYANIDAQATQYKGDKALQATFVERIETEDNKSPVTERVTQDILRQGEEDFALLTCGHPLELFTAEIGALVSPFFYQDSQHSFFVEPSLTETTTEQWEEWVISTPAAAPELDDDDYWEDLPIAPRDPYARVPFPLDPEDPGWLDPIDSQAHFMIEPKDDWVTDPATAVQFDERIIGQEGGLDSEVLRGTTGLARFDTLVNVSTGDRLTVVGGAGLNSGLLKKLVPGAK